MQQLADQAIADLNGTHFDIPEQVRRIECMLAPTSDGGIYYTGPSEDFSRPGRMWWAVPQGINEFSTWREVTTVYHEGVPGHHLQVAQTAVRAELLNRWQRLLCWCSGHGEGWALYSERLMDELGYLEDPGNKLGMLDGQAFRAARVIVDMGMHLELEIPQGQPVRLPPRRALDAGARVGNSCAGTAGSRMRTCVSSSTATLDGRVRPRRTRSANASGCRHVRTRRSARARTSTSRRSTAMR